MATIKRALLIGPSYPPDLPDTPQLESVQNNLRLMRGMLSRNGFHHENIMELEGDEASYDNMLLTLDKLSSIAEKKSVVVIYFSGHGWQITELDDTARSIFSLFHIEYSMLQELEGDMASRDNILYTLDKLSSLAEEKSVVVIYFSGHGYQLTDMSNDNQYFDQGILPAGLTKEMVDEYHIHDECITGEYFTPHLLKLLKKGCLVNTIFDCSFGCLKTESATLKRPPQLEFSKKVLQKYHEIFKDRSPINPSEKQLMKHDNESPQLAFSRKHMQEPHGISTARSPINQSEKQPTKYDNEPMEHEYYHQELRPPSPIRQYSRLQYPVQEFGTLALSWTPSDDDKFINIAATSSIEYAYDCKQPGTKVICGRLTSALVEVVDEAQREGKRISYNILKSQIKRKFAEREWTGQTPQFECGDMNLMLFDFDRVKQLIAIEVCESTLFKEFTKVKLNAGKLHGIVDGEYDVYTPDVTEEEVITRCSIDTIIVNRGDIDLLTSRGATLFKRDGTQRIFVGCKAVLRLRHSMRTPIIVKLPDFPLQREHQKQITLAIENQSMFVIENEKRADTVTLDVQIVEGKKCWRACQYGRMIVPYQEVGDEHLMMKNLSKYFRHRFAIEPKATNSKMLEHVSFKVFKIENVPSYKDAPHKRTELIAEAINTCDLYGDHRPRNVMRTFRAHKVELVKTMNDRKKYKVIDGSGDAMVIQVTNKENMPIHVCLVLYQADGSIVILHPPKNGDTKVLKPGESTQTIKRILLQPDTVRRRVEPDFNKPRPEECTDVLILYATTEKTNYEPLTQTAIELSPKLSTRETNQPDGRRLDFAGKIRDTLPHSREKTNYEPLTQTAIELSPKLSTRETNQPDGSRLDFAGKIRDALPHSRDKTPCARDGNGMWLTIRRDIRILCNQDPEAPASSPEPTPS